MHFSNNLGLLGLPLLKGVHPNRVQQPAGTNGYMKYTMHYKPHSRRKVCENS